MKYPFVAAALNMPTFLSAALLAATVPFANAEGTKAEEPGTSEEVSAEADTALIDEGREIFLNIADPACGICHTLAEAGAQGTIAPNLDDIEPDLDEVREALISGPGAMPDYSDRLSEEQIEAVSQYVAQATRSGQAAASDEDVPAE